MVVDKKLLEIRNLKYVFNELVATAKSRATIKGFRNGSNSCNIKNIVTIVSAIKKYCGFKKVVLHHLILHYLDMIV